MRIDFISKLKDNCCRNPNYVLLLIAAPAGNVSAWTVPVCWPCPTILCGFPNCYQRCAYSYCSMVLLVLCSGYCPQPLCNLFFTKTTTTLYQNFTLSAKLSF